MTILETIKKLWFDGNWHIYWWAITKSDIENCEIFLFNFNYHDECFQIYRIPQLELTYRVELDWQYFIWEEDLSERRSQ